jgi:hypothetical protein
MRNALKLLQTGVRAMKQFLQATISTKIICTGIESKYVQLERCD